MESVALIYSNRFENSNKFYHISLDVVRCSVKISYGRLGKCPNTSDKFFRSVSEAKSFFSKKISEKLKKGYEECDTAMILTSDGDFL